MKFRKLLVIIFLFGLIFLLPLVRPPIEFTAFPFQQHQVIVNVQGNSVHLSTSDASIPVRLNISYLDPEANSSQVIGNFIFNGNLEIDLEEGQRGNYLFEFLSTKIVKITIHDRGVPISTIGILAGVVILRVLIYIREFFSLEIQY